MDLLLMMGAGLAGVFVIAAGVVLGGWLVIRLSAAIVSRIPDEPDDAI